MKSELARLDHPGIGLPSPALWAPRRDFLRTGVLGALGLSLSEFFRIRAIAQEIGKSASTHKLNVHNAKAHSCILIWLDGGPSHLDMFDLKPNAPSEIRSVFNEIPSSVPGIRICEHLPRLAKSMNQLAVIRSLSHELGNHDTGTRFLLTGHRPTPSVEHPSIGSIAAMTNHGSSPMPGYVAIPHDSVGGNSNAAKSGYLPGAYNAFSIGNDPTKVEGLNPPEGISMERSDRRREILQKADRLSREVESNTFSNNRDAFYEQAYRLLASEQAKNAFDLSKEKQSVRDIYGSSKIGQGCLLARRLVEAGTRFITIVDSGWDMHQQIFRELPDSRFPGSGKLPALDRAVSGLITDLHERGLLDSTLVVMMGEFGRTPKINSTGGRDHWPRAGSVLLCGGGIKGGQVLGATNEFGEFPIESPVSPADLSFTILRLLGIDPSQELRTPSGRPMKLMSEGRFLSELV